MSLKLFRQLEHFNPIEKCQVIALLDDAEKLSQTYEGPWTAPWLHDSVHSLIWRVSKNHGTRFVNGELESFEQIYWDFALPDGSNLGDEKNLNFLHMIQKVAFLSREAPIKIKSPNANTHIAFIRFLHCVTRWVYLHKDLFDPENEFLRRIDANAIRDFLSKYSQGGYTFLLCYPERILTYLYEQVFQRHPSKDVLENLFCIPSNELVEIGKWLIKNDFIAATGRDKFPHLKRHKLSEILGGVSTSIFSSDRLNAFIQYLTPGCNSPLLTKSDQRREYFSHRTPLLQDAKFRKSPHGSLQAPLAGWAEIISMRRHLPEYLPSADCYKHKEFSVLIKRLGLNSVHTPWMPLKTALSYTTESLRWVHVYGEELVTLFLDVYAYFNKEDILDVQNYSYADAAVMRARRDQYVKDRIPQELSSLGISGCVNSLLTGEHNTYGDYSKLRSSPSLFDAVSILIGAVITLVGITKPIRQDEICNLDRDCIVFVKNDGYWIKQHQGKKNVGDVWAEDLRPIPAITAKSLLLIRRLSDGIKQINGIVDPWILSKLFIFPELGGLLKNTSQMTQGQSNKYIDFFCDYVGLSPDEYGRRWYLRVHETRKSFLITFFWCFRFSSLDAARWIAGHSDAQHIYAYIQANFPGEELPALEAEYAAQLMRDYESVGDKCEVEKLEELHRTVCMHFNVTQLSLVADDDLIDWMRMQFTKGYFQIQPYSINSEDGTVQTQIAFKLNIA